jgi:hypothetical protein
MAHKMKFSKEAMEGPKPVPSGIYTVAFAGFKPKKSKERDSINFNGMGKITGHPDYDGQILFAGLNTKIPNWIQDFVHSFGIEMEIDADGDATIPGVFDADQNIFKEDDLTTWRYAGPLVGQTAQWEVGVKPHYTNPNALSQDMIKYICSVKDCAVKNPDIKHSNDMRKKA